MVKKIGYAAPKIANWLPKYAPTFILSFAAYQKISLIKQLLKSNLTDFLFIENVKANLSSISKRQSVIFGAAEPFTLNIDGQMMSYISNDNDVADPNLTLN